MRDSAPASHTEHVLLQACLNGARLPEEHPALPVSAAQLAAATVAVVGAGADAVHVHPKDVHGADTLDAVTVASVLEAVRRSCSSAAWASRPACGRRWPLSRGEIGRGEATAFACCWRSWMIRPQQTRSQRPVGLSRPSALLPKCPVLLHGEGRSAWPVLEEAVHRGMDVRIGLEDVVWLPDGGLAADNAELVAAARRLIT